MRILLVEDSHLDQEMVKLALTEARIDHKLTVVETLSSAVVECRDGDHTVILLDLNLPDSEGLDTFLGVREICPHHPIVIMSGIDDPHLAHRAIQGGAQDFILKGMLRPEALARSLLFARQRFNREQDLRQIQDRVKRILKILPVAIWSTDEKGTITYFEGQVNATGIDKKSVVGVDVRTFGSDEEPQVVEFLTRALSGEAFSSTYKFHDRYYESHVSPLKEAGGRFTGVSAISADVTDRVEAEQALRASEERYAMAIRAANEGVWEWDLVSDKITFSEKIVTDLGYLSAVDGPATIQEWEAALHPDDHDAVMVALKTAIMTGSRFAAEYRFWLMGEYRWFQVRGDTQRDEAGTPVRMVGTLADITARKRAEAEVQARARQLAALAELGQIALTAQNLTEVMDASTRLVAQSLSVEHVSVIRETGSPEGQVVRAVYGDANYAPDDTCSETSISISDETGSYGHLRVLTTCQREFTTDDQALLHNVGNLLSASITRTRAEKRIRHQVGQLEAMRTVDLAIASSHDLNVSLQVLLEQVVTQLRVDAAAVLLLNRHTNRLEWGAGKGFTAVGLRNAEVGLGQGHAGAAAFSQRPVTVEDVRISPTTLRLREFAEEGFISYVAVPLLSKGSTVGVLETYWRRPYTAKIEWLDYLQAMAGQAAIAIDNARLFRDFEQANIELRLAYDMTLEGWSRALDLRDRETEGHSRRVTDATLKLARTMGMAETDLVHVRRGALLHDIGKMGIPDSILLKPGPLTPEEWVVMKKHPVYAYDFLYPIHFLRPAVDIPYCHHEKWDGTGYPRGLKGEEIPMAARVFAVIDVWDALSSDRPYRKAWPVEKIIDHIKASAGTHFNHDIVEVFLYSGIVESHTVHERLPVNAAAGRYGQQE